MPFTRLNESLLAATVPQDQREDARGRSNFESVRAIACLTRLRLHRARGNPRSDRRLHGSVPWQKTTRPAAGASNSRQSELRSLARVHVLMSIAQCCRETVLSLQQCGGFCLGSWSWSSRCSSPKPRPGLAFSRQRRIWQRRASTSCLFRTTEHFRAIGRRVPRSAFYLVTEDADALQLALEDGGL